MIHKDCGGNIVIDVSSVYRLRSPSIVYTQKGISPGMIEIDTSGKRGVFTLLCEKCEESFSQREEFEKNILEKCDACGEFYSPSEIKITDYIPKICIKCINKENRKEVSTARNRYISLFGEAIKSLGDAPALLTILMKKQ